MVTVRRDERGQAGGVEALAFGLLTFVIGALIVANAWGVIDAKFAADGAAREGARAYVETGGTLTEADRPARSAADAALASLRRTGTVDVALDDAYRRCGEVTVRVTTRVPLLRLPFVRPAGGHVTVHGVETRRIDPYRSGIRGGAVSC